MEHKIPSIREVNLEISDFDFYYNGVIDPEDVHYRLEVSPSFEARNKLVFFIHVRAIYTVEESSGERKEFSVFHTDYLCTTEVKDRSWENGGQVEVRKTFLAHILGMCFLMIRGAISIRLKSHPLYNFPLPILNPLEMLEEALEEKDDNFLLTYEKIGHVTN